VAEWEREDEEEERLESLDRDDESSSLESGNNIFD